MGERRIDMKRYSWIFGALLVLTSCTGDFKDINTDLSGITDEDLQIDYNEHGIRLGVIQQGIYFNYDYGKGKNWPFQLTQNLNADMFSGYMHDGKPLNGGSHNSDYNLQDGWNSAMWGHTYSYIFPQIYQSENATREKHPGFFGVTKILKVEVMHRVTDYYGPIIYSRFADPNAEYMPDTQEAVYKEFFCELDTAVSTLTGYAESNPEAAEFSRFDILMDGEYISWIRFANSLRMRLAMRIATVDEEKARSEFLKAFNNEYGTLEAENEPVAVSTKKGYTNPLGELNLVWNETYMSAPMESIMNGYEDPRRTVFFATCQDESFKGQYRGIRQGTCFSHQYGIMQTDSYLNSDKLPIDFVDTFDAENNIKAYCKVSPKWIETADRDTKLEKIITQKWLAMFPEGCEAWAEQRRTGYPRLFPVRFNHSKDGCVDTEIMIRRLNFPGGLQTENPEQYRALVKALGGDDNAGTRLWWDTGTNW